MDGKARNIYNIPAGFDFSRILAQQLLHETRDAPESLSRYRILLPTRRACRVLRDSFLDLSDGRPVLLPHMHPVGDVDEEDLSFVMFGGDGGVLDVLPAMPPLLRQILLARLIARADGFVQGYDHALLLAKALAQLMDKVATEELSLANLKDVVPHEFAQHWQITLGFLEIIIAHWPVILQAHGMVDGAARRVMLIRALANHWQENAPQTPVIAAGSTGSIPATGALLSVIAGLPQGRIILPGLDIYMDDEAWGAIEESHPQYGLKKLLHRVEVARSDVVNMAAGQEASPRGALLSQVMLPASATRQWHEFAARADMDKMIEGLSYSACKSQQEEAQLIAVLVRGVLEKPAQTVALITPDRGLARRVIALCRRWGIEADDSAGQSLSQSRIGRFMILAMSLGGRGFEASALLAFLKHTLCHMGHENDVYRKYVRDLEKEVLRGRTYIADYAQMVAAAQAHGEGLGEFCARVVVGLSPLTALAQQDKTHGFSEVLRAHIAVLEYFAAMPDAGGADVLWRGDDGEAASYFLIDLIQAAHEIGDVDLHAYDKIMQQFMGQVTVRTPYGVHPRFAVLGQLEARLTSADMIIMGGLSEGVWPASASHDPWMSRKMSSDFGLPTQEKGIGLAAHDFAQGFCARRVVMTRAQQIDGAPSVASRWLQRMDTVLKGAGKRLSDLEDISVLSWMRSMDYAPQTKTYARPMPSPPLSVRPSRVSVTKIEGWLRDPYMIYAYYVLRLRKLEDLDRPFDRAQKGTILHDILHHFVEQYPVELPQDIHAEMVRIAHDVIAQSGVQDDDLHFWWPDFMRNVQAFAAHEQEWRADAKFFKAEAEGEITLDVDGRSFVMNGRADRIDRMHGGYALVDYKTSKGKHSAGGIKKGALPQLPIEAMMLSCGGFKDIPRMDAHYMGYWIMNGRANDGFVESISGADVAQAIEIVQAGLMGLLRAFLNDGAPFFAIPDMKNAPDYNDYAHLERIKEWVVMDDPSAGEDA